MPSKPESKLWAQMRQGTKPLDVLWTRIESWSSPGVPDLFGVYKGECFWVELKLHKLKSVKRIDLSPQQILWQTRHSQAGANVWNLVGHPASGSVKLFRGTRAMEIGRKTGRDETRPEDLVPCCEYDSPYEWTKVMETIAFDRV